MSVSTPVLNPAKIADLAAFIALTVTAAGRAQADTVYIRHDMR